MSQLVEGELPINALASQFDMARPSFTQHLNVPQGCGLITSEKRGRSRWCRLVTSRFQEAADWMEAERRRWAERPISVKDGHKNDSAMTDR